MMRAGNISFLTGAIWIALICASAFGLFQLAQWKERVVVERDKASTDFAKIERSIAALSNEIASYETDALDDFVWQVNQLGQATAEIQTTVNQLAQKAGITLRSVGPVAPRNSNLGDALGFRMEFEASLDQLTAYLRALEYHQPTLLVSNATFRRIVRPGDTSELPRLFAQIDVTAPITSAAEVQQ